MFIPIEFQKAFDKTRRPVISITATYQKLTDTTHSQFGGIPYWEHCIALPVDNDERPMALLAQINFSELPCNDWFPARGILQFFIPQEDEQYGADFDQFGTPGKLFVKFWESPAANLAIQASNHLEDLKNTELIPASGSHALDFTLSEDIAGMDTIECAEAMKNNPFEILESISLDDKEAHKFFDNIADTVSAQGHKLLGYPYFINGDPRTTNSYRLLLQIDTDQLDDNDIMWGNHGVGYIFIRNEDLQSGRFENVWFYWDSL